MVEPVITKVSHDAASGTTIYNVAGQNDYEKNNRPSTGYITATDTVSGNHLFPVSGSGIGNLGIPDEAFPNRDLWTFGSDRMSSTAKAIAVLDKDDRLVGYLLGRMNGADDKLTVDRMLYTDGMVQQLDKRHEIGLENGLFGKETAEDLSQIAIKAAEKHGSYHHKKEPESDHKPEEMVAGNLSSPRTPAVAGAKNVDATHTIRH